MNKQPICFDRLLFNWCSSKDIVSGYQQLVSPAFSSLVDDICLNLGSDCIVDVYSSFGSEIL
jgi:hypothetical protein